VKSVELVDHCGNNRDFKNRGKGPRNSTTQSARTKGRKEQCVKREFHHIGIPVGQKTPDMVYYESIKCWATDPDATQGRIEYIFFENGTPITEPVLSQPHVAFRVDNLEEGIQDRQCVLGPIKLPEGVEVAFFYVDGCLTEYHQVIQ
jgi:hypothetical protein